MISECRSLLLALAVSVAAWPSNARGAESANTKIGAEASKRRFSEAVRLYKDGSVERALPAFSEVAQATGSPNAHLYVGYCLTKLDRPAEAHAAFEAAAKASGNDERYEETRAAALAELAGLSLRVAKLVVSPAELPHGLEVTVDGERLNPASFGLHRVLRPGDHRVEAVAPGVKSVVREVRIEAGETKTVTLYFPKEAPPPAKTPPPRSARNDTRTAFKIAGFAAAGVSVIGLTTFAIAGLSAKGTYSDLERNCPDGCTDPARQEDIDGGKSAQTVANVGLAVGGVSAAASAVLLYFGFAGGEKAGLAGEPLRGGALVTYRSRF